MTAAMIDQRPTALLVLGMHRSGTSALTGTLGLLGVDLGRRLIDPGPDNRKGYWEHADAVLADEALLDALGSAWDDVDPLPEAWGDHPATGDAKRAIDRLVGDEFAGSRLWAVKDPRMCRLLPVWIDALHAREVRVALIYMVRHPAEIAASLQARDHLHPEASALLTLRHLIEAERAGRECARTVLGYDELMAAPDLALERVATELGVAWPTPVSARIDAIRAFLDPGDRHHRVEVSTQPAAPNERLGRLAIELHAAFAKIAAGAGEWSAVAGYGDAVDALATAPANDASAIELHRLCSRRARQVSARNTATQAELRTRIDEDETAIRRLERLSLDRLDEMKRLSLQLAATQHALADAERLSLERLAALEETDGALGRVTQLSLERLAQIETLTRQAEEAERLLAEACHASLGHLQDASGLDARVAVTVQAILELSGQSLSQRQQLQVLEASQEALNLALAAEHSLRVAMERSLSWRITAPLRYLRRMLSSRGRAG